MNMWAGLNAAEKEPPRRYFKAPKVENPWSLTGAQMRVLEAIIKTGCNISAAESLSLSVSSVNFHTKSIVKKMGVENRTLAALVFDRWKRAQQ